MNFSSQPVQPQSNLIYCVKVIFYVNRLIGQNEESDDRKDKFISFDQNEDTNEDGIKKSSPQKDEFS
jgi:hypothetical protein